MHDAVCMQMQAWSTNREPQSHACGKTPSATYLHKCHTMPARAHSIKRVL